MTDALDFDPRGPSTAGDLSPAMPDGYHVRPFRPGDEPGILAVLQAAFARWPRPELDLPPIDYLRWKLDSHDVARGFAWVIERGDRIVAVNLGMIREAKLRDRTIVIDFGAEIAILPEHQGRGLFWAIRDAARPRRAELVHAMFGSAMNAAVLHIREREGRRALAAPMEMLILPLRSLRVLRREGPRALPRTLRGLGASHLRRHAHRPGHGGSPVAIEEITEPDERFDALWAEASPAFDFAAVRSCARLRWRLGDRRGGSFTILGATEGGRLAGYVAFRVSRGRGYVADVLVAPGRRDALEALIDAALERLRAGDIDDVSCWLPRGHAYGGALRRRGFARFGEAQLGISALSIAAEELAFLLDSDAPIHLTLADVDGADV